MKKTSFLALSLLSFILSACNCGTPLKIKSIQNTDKDLTCQDVILEINEAEFFRREAALSQRISVEEILTPTCWVSGYLKGSEAARSANGRIEYLSQIYDLMQCGTENPLSFREAQNNASSMNALTNNQMAYPNGAALKKPQVPSNLGITSANSNMKKNPIDPNVHVHISADGTRYMHSHPHNGSHTHPEDLVMPKVPAKSATPNQQMPPK